MKKIIKTIFYLCFVISSNFNYSQSLWLGDWSVGSLYVIRDNNILLGSRLGISTVSKKRFVFSFDAGVYHSSKKMIHHEGGYRIKYFSNYIYTLMPQITIDTPFSVISSYRLMLGYTTDINKKLSYAFQVGPALLYGYTGSGGLPHASFVFLNTNIFVRYELFKYLYLKSYLGIRDYRYTNISWGLGVDYLINKKAKENTWTFADSVRPKITWRVGVGTSINKTVFDNLKSMSVIDSATYYSNLDSHGVYRGGGRYFKPDDEKMSFYYQTVDLHLDVHIRWLVIKNMLRIYTNGYSSKYSVRGNSRVFNHIFWGISNRYKNKKFYYTIAVGSCYPENLHYEVKGKPHDLKVYEHIRWIRSSIVEFGFLLNNKNTDVSIYLGRVGDIDRSTDSSPGSVGVVFPMIWNTYLGIKLSQRINL